MRKIFNPFNTEYDRYRDKRVRKNKKRIRIKQKKIFLFCHFCLFCSCIKHKVIFRTHFQIQIKNIFLQSLDFFNNVNNIFISECKQTLHYFNSYCTAHDHILAKNIFKINIFTFPITLVWYLIITDKN